MQHMDESETYVPMALICGLLECGEKILFVVRKDPESKRERYELPCVHGSLSADP